MYEIQREYYSIMMACKYPYNNNVKHCISKIIDLEENYINEKTINFWLSKTIEEFRPYAKNIKNQTISDMIDWIYKTEFIYGTKFKNLYESHNKYMKSLLEMVKVRNSNGDIYKIID